MADFVSKYGCRWKPVDGRPPDRLSVELACFRHNHSPSLGGLGKYGHFKEVCNILWPWNEAKKTGFQWNPWVERMARGACTHKYLGVSGAASSSKTSFFSIWGIVNWIAAPHETLVLVTSTSLTDARKRIWGQIRERYQTITGMPGKLVDSQGIIRIPGSPEGDLASISLVAGSPEKEKEATKKLIGLKQKRIILIGDELPELSSSVVEACYALDKQIESFQFIGLGNFASLFDPFGEFITPVHGWGSVTVDDEEWATVKGHCIHLDGLKAPNIEDNDMWYGMLTKQHVADAAKDGVNTLNFWRFIRSFPAPSGEEDAIYSEADFRKYGALEMPHWEGEFTNVGGLDPSYSNGGDRCVLRRVRYGRTTDNLMTIAAIDSKSFFHDVTKSEEPRTHQICKQVIEYCRKYGITPDHLGVDASGAGDVFCDVLETLWGQKVRRVYFNGKATDRPISSYNDNLASDKYDRKVTELWFCGVEFLRAGQIKGIDPVLAKEMTMRKYDTIKAGGEKVRAETKQDMKLRAKRSPDEADAFFIALDVCRDVFGAIPGGEFKVKQKVNWKDRIKKFSLINRTLGLDTSPASAIR